MSKATYWTNEDGLTIGYGRRTSEYGTAAKVSKGGEYEELVLEFLGTELADAAAPANFKQGAMLPAGTYIVSALLLVDTSFASDGGTATLDIGTFDVDGAAIDIDGLVAAAAEATLVAGADIAGAGDQVGATLTEDAYLAATYGTEAFTAGKARLIVRYILPS